MSEHNLLEFPPRYEAEIALAERSEDLIEQRLATGKLPDDALPRGDVAAFVDAVAELLHLEELDEDGRTVSQKRVEEAVRRLEQALNRIGEWPDVPRTVVMAPLAEALEEFELDWIVFELLSLMPDWDLVSADELPFVGGAIRRIVPIQVWMMLENDTWAPEFEALLLFLRELAEDDPEDRELSITLQRGVLHHALHGREALVEDRRRALASAEPLPPALASALDELAEEVSEQEIFTLSLHLVLADALAAGLVPKDAHPHHMVAAAVTALVNRDQPDERVDVRSLARVVKAPSRTIEKLAQRLDAALDWAPPGFDGEIELRQYERWRLASAMLQFMPARWIPAEDAQRPPYTEAGARARLEELRDVAWLMPEPFEAARFVAEYFSYGGDAPDEMEGDIALEIINLWKQERVVDIAELTVGDEEFDEEVDEDWEDDEELDHSFGHESEVPELVTTDGQPIVFCTTEYEVAAGREAEVVRRIDAMDGVQREQPDGGECWVCFEAGGGRNLVLGRLALDGRRLELETMSVERSARLGARLAEALGDLIVLVDLKTQRMTEASLRRTVDQGPGDEPPLSPEVQRRVVLTMLESHYRDWLDEPIPALGDLTPREAAADAELRPQVVELLLDFERRNRSAPEAMRDFDFGFLWDELGLDRGQKR